LVHGEAEEELADGVGRTQAAERPGPVRFCVLVLRFVDGGDGQLFGALAVLLCDEVDLSLLSPHFVQVKLLPLHGIGITYSDLLLI